MAADLEMQPHEVHECARAVLNFWFALPAQKHFAKDAVLDREITARFGPLRNRVYASDARGWGDDADSLLAAIIVLDQFSRNIHRGTARAFEADDLATMLTLRAIEKGWDAGMSVRRLQFLYMPLMHAEDVPLQRLSLEKYGALGDDDILKFARDHAAVVEQFGRFPSRNAALGRRSTALETEYLARPDAGW
jgi:uncharacterized protein (DUF924 family)